MADNVDVVDGAYTATVSADEAASGQVQRVKLAIATDGSDTHIPADASGLLVKSATAANFLVTETSAAAAAASLATLDNIVSGNEAQVDVLTLPAIPAGTNNIGDVDVLTIAAGDNNIGNVDIVTLPALAAGTNNIGDVDVLTLPAKKITYAASAAQTQTNLDGLAASSTHVAGWEGTAIDNSSNLYLDYIVNAKIQVESAGLGAGEIRLYFVAELEDSSWPDVFDGTESAETVTSTQIRDAICRLGAYTVTTTDASRVYYLNCPSVAHIFNGVLPRKFVPFITHSTTAALETTGDPNQVYVKGVYLT